MKKSYFIQGLGNLSPKKVKEFGYWAGWTIKDDGVYGCDGHLIGWRGDKAKVPSKIEPNTKHPVHAVLNS